MTLVTSAGIEVQDLDFGQIRGVFIPFTITSYFRDVPKVVRGISPFVFMEHRRQIKIEKDPSLEFLNCEKAECVKVLIENVSDKDINVKGDLAKSFILVHLP